MIILLHIFIVKSLDVNLIPEYGTPPSERYWVSMTYCSDASSIVVFGGTDDENFFSDVWTFNLDESVWAVHYPSTTSVPGK
jgi:Galactose oxidase, central domain